MKKRKIIIMVSIIVVFVGVLAILFLQNYMYNNGLSGRYEETEAKKEQIKVACVGDSITYGHGISDWKNNSYPAQLQRILGEKYHVANFGSSGACVNPSGDQPYESREAYQKSLDYEADILIFMIGTNDSKPENWNGEESFLKDYKALLDSYRKGQKAPKVYIGLCAESIWIEETNSSKCEFDIQPAIVDKIVEAIKAEYEAAEKDIEIVDIHTLTEEHPEWFKKDGVHPDNEGAKAIAEAFAEAIKRTNK